jgi:membrane-bound lytic murein transglycosylase D
MNLSKLKTIGLLSVLFLAAQTSQANDILLADEFKNLPLIEQERTMPDDELEKLLSSINKSSFETRSMQDEADLWVRIRNGFAIQPLDNGDVEKQVAKFAMKPASVENTSLRASKYLFYVVEQIERRKMPMEIALLPFIESAFNPQAYSSAKAAGMWQFIPSTGLYFKLKQNVFKDERRDVVASTDAALTYLQKLHDMFDDWQLALAAYNWGEGAVAKAVKKNQDAGLPIDFASLTIRMPDETKNYVPKLLAIKEIINNPGRYGVILPSVNNKPYFTSIPKTRDIDVKLAAQLAEIPVAEFKALNPQFNRAVITGDSSTSILLPASNAQKFKNNLKQFSASLTNWTAHTVTGARERISLIAKRFGTTSEVIRSANNIPLKMEVAAGSTLLVPKMSTSIDRDIALEVSNNASIFLVDPPAPPPVRSFRKSRGDNVSTRKKAKTASNVDSKNDHKKIQLASKLDSKSPHSKVQVASSKVELKSLHEKVQIASKTISKKILTASKVEPKERSKKIQLASRSDKTTSKTRKS